MTQLRQQQAGAAPSDAKAKRPDRPVIEANISDNDWALFEDTWKRYKAMTGLTSEDKIRMELRASCSPDVNKLLFEFVGPTILDRASEVELMGHIKGIAVKGLHKEVHRMNFSKIKQGDGENVTHYVARLKSQGSLCNFSVQCACHEKVSYAEDMAAQQLVTGLRDQEHQSKILSEATALTTLHLKVESLQSLEATEESATKLHIPTQHSVAGAMKSGYRRGKDLSQRSAEDKKGDLPKKCIACGRTTHYGRSMAIKDCPAHKKKCNTCGKEGHFAAVCRSTRSKASAGVEDEGEFDEGCTEASTSFFFATSSVDDEGVSSEQDFRLRPPTTSDG